MRLAIGSSKASMQDLSKDVGIASREQVALEEVSIICLISAVVAGMN